MPFDFAFRNKKFTEERMEEWRLLEKSNRVSIIAISVAWIFILVFLIVFDSVMLATDSYDKINW
jgi:hypothetical protein